MPRGEDAAALLRDVTPALDEVRRTRAASLAHVPEGAAPLEQRSRVIAPLIAQRELLGYLYCDIDGAFGRFRDADRDLLGMLGEPGRRRARQRAVVAGPRAEGRTAHRGAEASKALIEQRASELAIINSIQEGMAAELDFQAIVDLVGDKLREVFNTADLGIRWYDEKTNLVHYLYAYEHGTRLHIAPQPPTPGGMGETMRRTRRPLSSIPPQTTKRCEAGLCPAPI